MRNLMRTCSVFAAALLLYLMIPYASASPVTDRTGSVTIRMTYRGEAVPGGSVTLYRIAGLGNGVIPEPEFADSGVDLNGTLGPGDAKKLADHAQTHGAPGQTIALGPAGTVRFSGLETGLYLLVQSAAGRGYLPVHPFLLSIPQQIGGELFYDVDASPKCAPEPTDPAGPEGPPPPGIPQTGQLNWPVPLMAAVGMTLAAAGARLFFCPGRDEHEK